MKKSNLFNGNNEKTSRQGGTISNGVKRKPLSDYLDRIKSALDQQNFNKARRIGENASRKFASLEHSSREEYLLYSRLGHSYYLLAQYSLALDAFYKAFLIAQNNSFHPADQNYISAQMGDIFRLIGNSAQALRQFQKVEQYYKRYGYDVPPMNKRFYAAYLMSLVGCYLQQGESDKARNIIAVIEADNILLQNQTNYNHFKGEYLLSVGKYEDSREAFLKSIEISRQESDQCGWLQASIHLAQIDLIEGKAVSAVKLLNVIIKSARKLKLNELVCESGLFLSKCYMIRNLPEKALAIEERIKPVLSKLDTVWLYEKTRESERFYHQLQTIGKERYNVRNLTATKSEPVPNVLIKTLNHRYETSLYKEMVIGSSVAMQEIFTLIEKIAPTDLPVLIQGQTGTGKELIAQAIHANSQRSDKTFLAFNCGAIPESLLESALFGHTRGAFTGAVEDKKGYIELASGGTLFIDEIGNMSGGMQQKLLRVLEEEFVWPIGATKQIPIDTRFIFASNQDIERLVKKKLFREDLFYRINTIVINMPSLRERKEDIPLLIEHFLSKYSSKTHDAQRLEPDALRLLTAYPWHGNIRELENEVQRICVLNPGANIITESMLSESIRECSQTTGKVSEGLTLIQLRKKWEKDIITQTIKKYNGNIAGAAKQLGYALSPFYRKMKHLKITPEQQDADL